MLELEAIKNRLEEIPKQLDQIIAERNQLLGYKQALEDCDKCNKEHPSEKLKSEDKPKKVKNEN